MKSINFFELRSEEVQEILTQPPRWLLRWGIATIFLVLISIFGGAWLIHYPDIVRGSFKLTSANEPKTVIARTQGKLVRLIKNEGQLVKAGVSISYLESTAKHDQVLRLLKELDYAWKIANKGNIEALDKLNLYNYSQMGDLQNAYQLFEQEHIKIRAYLANGYYSQKKRYLKQKIVDLKALALNLDAQKEVEERDLVLSQEDYNIQKQLADQKVIAVLDLKREEIKKNARKLPLQQTASALINNLMAQRAIQEEISALDQQVVEERSRYLQTLSTLQSAIQTWKLKYVLTAPVSGIVHFIGNVQENQVVDMNQELFYVTPQSGEYFGELLIPQQNAGKVNVGQDVIVKFTGYPFTEFGAVKGRIASIAGIPLKDSIFLAKVLLPNGLVTNYGKSLSYRTGMSASAEIITADTRLLEKLFFQFRSLFEQY